MERRGGVSGLRGLRTAALVLLVSQTLSLPEKVQFLDFVNGIVYECVERSVIDANFSFLEKQTLSET